ncbi:MAG TPA: isocitrate/isopropylmalate family dehydrogenase [Verrucomicrobiae bacterium]|jgi:3-isopropylmalate dehydrogenase|nr:isocitrate/isopropylmalate family dehydrogenase [Verrucomicrobiae bacterium]
MNQQSHPWSDFVFTETSQKRAKSERPLIGILKGEGIGNEVISAALTVLSALESAADVRFEVRTGGVIGTEAEALHGKPLSGDVIDFCGRVFADGGAVLAGPGGGRFVYDLRREFDLFCKFSPLRVCSALVDDNHLKPEHVRNLDMLLVRENAAGIYQGQWQESTAVDGGRKSEQSFSYTEFEVRRILKVAASVAAERRGILHVVIKDGGVPGISKLWRDCAEDITRTASVQCHILNVDLVAYLMVQHPQKFDVMVSPNLFGDILADLGGALLGSRALSFSGNFSAAGAAVYQTNHGAAYDLAGTNQANPAGQIYSLAMLLRESFGLMREADIVESALAEVWRQSWRTADLVHGGNPIGTKEMAERVAGEVLRLLRQEVAA